MFEEASCSSSSTIAALLRGTFDPHCRVVVVRDGEGDAQLKGELFHLLQVVGEFLCREFSGALGDDAGHTVDDFMLHTEKTNLKLLVEILGIAGRILADDVDPHPVKAVLARRTVLLV